MRNAAVLLLVVTACTTDPVAGPEAPPQPASLRERLEQRTQLLVDRAASGGSISAERHVTATGGWEGGPVALAITNGELIISTEGSGASELTLVGLQVSFEPLQIPAGVFGGRDAKLTNVRFDLSKSVHAPATWIGDDEVHLTTELPLALTWELVLDGSPAPLGSPKLPAVPVEIVVTGSGAHAEASLAVSAPGELWSWANLVRIGELELTLSAALPVTR